MDQSISCQEISHIYKHPLSILIHLKYQDKDGVSRNGSREFLYETGYCIGKRSFYEQVTGGNIFIDHRGVLFNINFSGGSRTEMEDVMSRWKHFKFAFSKSNVPICEEDARVLNQYRKETGIVSNADCTKFIENPSNSGLFRYITFKSLGGKIVSFGSTICYSSMSDGDMLETTTITIISQLPFLRHYSSQFVNIQHLRTLSKLSNVTSLSLSFDISPHEDDGSLTMSNNPFDPFTNLKSLSISSYPFTDQISVLSKLNMLRLSFCNFRYEGFPSWLFFSFPNLCYLTFMDCQLRGEIPIQFASMFNLRLLEFQRMTKKFEGDFPMEICQLPNLYRLVIESDCGIDNKIEVVRFMEEKMRRLLRVRKR